MRQKSRTGRFAGLMLGGIRAIVCAAAVLLCVVRLPATAAEPKQQTNASQTNEAVFKGHRLATLIDPQTHRATIELDNRPVMVKDGVTVISKISYVDLGPSFLYYLHITTTAGYGSYIMVRVVLAADPGKSEVLSDFGACNDKLTTQLQTREGWTAWYAIAYRNDSANARVALIHDDKLTTREVKAPPCLFEPVAQWDCLSTLLAEANGSGELGLPTGEGTFADQKVAAFFNHTTGKATLQLNGRVFRTFDNVKDFYLAAVDGEDQFGLFSFFLKPATGCLTRPLLFFAGRGSEPQVIMDYAPCTDKMARITRKKGKVIEWFGIGFHPGEPHGYVASVIDHKLSTRTTLLPLCMMDADKVKEQSCVLEALGLPAPPPSQPPQVHVVPAPPASASRRAPRPLGI